MKQCFLPGPVTLPALLFAVMLLPALLPAQQRTTHFSLSLPVQVEFQQGPPAFSLPPNKESQTPIVLNFGLRAQLHQALNNRWELFGGLGYFRERFNLRRGFDHSALNEYREGFGIATITKSYTYHLLEIPVGVNYLLSTGPRAAHLGLSYIPAFAVSSYYEGWTPPIENANNTDERFRFFSHSILLAAGIPFGIGRQSFSIDPYLRLLHYFKKDQILFEDPSQFNKLGFDAIGVAFTYRFSLPGKKRAD